MGRNYFKNWKFAFEILGTFTELNVNKVILYSEDRKYSQDLITPLGLIFLFCLKSHFVSPFYWYKCM